MALVASAVSVGPENDHGAQKRTFFPELMSIVAARAAMPLMSSGAMPSFCAQWSLGITSAATRTSKPTPPASPEPTGLPEKARSAPTPTRHAVPPIGGGWRQGVA